MKPRILNTIGNIYAEKAKKILASFASVDYKNLEQEEFTKIIKDYDILLVGLGLKIGRKEIDAGKNLKIIATATTGLDHIDIPYAESKGIKILSLRGENKFLDTITGTAELSVGLMISLMRFIPQSFDSVKSGNWDRNSFKGNSLLGKTVGVVGLGRLGKMTARYCEGFGMKVLFCDPFVKNCPNKKWEKASFDKLLKDSDVVSIHVHLNKDTENMFDNFAFKKMKPTAFLINTSRGKIVSEKDLIHALEEKGIAGYATDVLSGELDFRGRFENNPLVEYSKRNKNVVVVPHIGGVTHESREATDIFIAEKIKKNLKKSYGCKKENKNKKKT